MTPITKDLKMDTDLNYSELFDRYLENDLNTHERQRFELRIKEDSALAERFRLHKEVDLALIEEDVLRFRLQLSEIGFNNSELVQSPPMVIAEEAAPDFDHAILEQDIMALRDQLNRIHTSVIEEVDPIGIMGYSGIENAILRQDSLALNRELGAFDELLASESMDRNSSMALLVRDVDQAILQQDVMSLRASLEEIGGKAAAARKVIPMRTKVIRYASSAVAAVFILLAAGNFILNQTSGSLTSDRTISKYFQPYEGQGVKRGKTDESSKFYENGIQKYNKGDFKNATEWFEASLNGSERDEMALLYCGSIARMDGDPDKALGYFENWNEISPTYPQVEWFKAGCYLQKKDLDSALAILKKISLDVEHDFYDKASALLKKYGKDF